MKARFSIIGKIVDQIKYDPSRKCADFTVRVIDGHDRYHVTGVTEDDFLALSVAGCGATVGIVGYFVQFDSHISLKPRLIYILDKTDVDNFNFVSDQWAKSHLMAGKSNH